MRLLGFLFGFVSMLAAHDLHHRVEHSECIAVAFSFEDKSDFSYQAYELYAPGDKIPYQVGRTDRDSSLCFRPTRKGAWVLKAFGEDGHGATFEIAVDETLSLADYDRPLFEKFQKLFVGLALLFALYGGFYYYKTRRKQ